MQLKFIEKLQQPLCDGWELGGSIGGALIGAAGQAITNKQNQEYQKELMGIQHGYNEQSAEAAYQRQRELNAENWKLYNSYEAQRANMEAAGLSPALMYGMNGVGGSGAGNTAPQAQGVGLPQAALGNVGAAAIQGAQLGLMNAEIRKTDAETQRIKGITPAEIADTWASVDQRNANAKYQLAQERLSNLLGDNQEIKNTFEGQHQLYQLNKEFNNILLQTIQYQREGRLNKFEEETYNEKVKQYQEQTKRITAETALINSQKELTDKNKELAQKELDNFQVRIHNEIMTAVGKLNQGQAAIVNATAAVEELNARLEIEGIKLEQKDLELYIEACKVSGEAKIGLGIGPKGINVNAGGGGSSNWARGTAKNNLKEGSKYTHTPIKIEVDWAKVNK